MLLEATLLRYFQHSSSWNWSSGSFMHLQLKSGFFFTMWILQNKKSKPLFLGSPSSSSSSTWRYKAKKKQRYPFLYRQYATRLAVFWVGVWLIFSWVEKFSSLALTISIVIAASTHTYSIRNSAGCNKFTPVLWRVVEWNSGKYRS